jgi:hypothetical protein
VKTQSESYSSDPGGHIATDWPVQEFEVREDWKCASMKNLEDPK